jgi:hypothetical protein
MTRPTAGPPTGPIQVPTSAQWTATSPWVIDAPAQQADLDERGTGETTFTVTNFGPAQNRVMFEIVPGDGASENWFAVPEQQRLVSAAGSVSYRVLIRVPPGTAPGSYEFTGRAYSADGPPEETSTTSNRVRLEVKGGAKRTRKLNPLVLVAIAVLVLVVLGVTAFFLFRGGDVEGGEVVLANQSLAVPLNNAADLDTAEIVRAGGTIQLRVVGADQFLLPFGGTKMANLGVVDDPSFESCAEAPVLDVVIPLRTLTPGAVLCVETPQQRMAVVTVVQVPGRQLEIQYDLFRHKSAG